MYIRRIYVYTLIFLLTFNIINWQSRKDKERRKLLVEKTCLYMLLDDLCNPNPCGTNAICTVYNNTRREKPVCSCRTGYIGDSVISCQRVECFTDSDCPDNRACIDFACSNPCTNSECASNATCTPRRHMAVCTCPRGTRGDALYTCNPIYYNRLSEPSKNEYYKP